MNEIEIKTDFRMKQEEFKKYIKSIGFENYTGGNIYDYKGFRIDLYNYFYYFYIGSEWSGHYYTDLDPIYKYFKRELRSIKLKALLYFNIS
jgi:hypothetical protein